MCGIIGIWDPDQPVGDDLYRGLVALQHRGQEGAGLVTFSDRFHLIRGQGLLDEILPHVENGDIPGHWGLGHVRYATSGSGSADETQPFLTPYPIGLALVHNGNLTNQEALRAQLKDKGRMVLSDSDSEVLLGILATNLTSYVGHLLDAQRVFEAVGRTMAQLEGAYSVIVLLGDQGILAFRDPHGIRPLAIGRRNKAYAFASESIALEMTGFDHVEDVGAGEAIWIQPSGTIHRRLISQAPSAPCAFEYIYFARPESVMQGISVSEVREALGKRLAQRAIEGMDVDVVSGVPSSAEEAAMSFARHTNLTYRRVIRRNPYITRSFIQPHQKGRQRVAKLKYLLERRWINGRRLAIVDDSIVRGHTARELANRLKELGAERLELLSSAPPVRHPCCYGIDMAIPQEMIAHGRTDEQISHQLGVDRVVYATPDDVIAALQGRPACLACFTGRYPTAVSAADREALGAARAATQKDPA